MYTQVKSSGAMEPYAAKTLLKNLVTEHELTPDSLTTDRSSTMKNMIRFFLCKNMLFVENYVILVSSMRSCLTMNPRYFICLTYGKPI